MGALCGNVSCPYTPSRVNLSRASMSEKRIRLDLVVISNYLGAGSIPVSLKLGGEHAVLFGPNGSGKTTALSALNRIGRISWGSVLQSYGSSASGSGPASWNVTVSEWADARPQVTADLFHGDAEIFRTGVELRVPKDLDADGVSLLALLSGPYADSIQASFATAVRRDQKVQLESVYVDNRAVFRMGETTSTFSALVTDRTARQAGLYSYRAEHAEAHKLFGLSNSLLQRIVYFPSQRQATLGSDTDISGLAGGGGLVSWIEHATNPDPRDYESSRRHGVLQEFQREFAEFIGCKSISLSVREYSREQLLNNEQPEINVTLDRRLRRLSQLGAGIGESLIILLVSKLSQEWRNPPVDVVLLEEPELHLHPTLQRKLLERLAAYGVQLIVSTHSPSVVNWFARNGGRIFGTEFLETESRTSARQISGLIELRGVIESIGASPGDVALADKVLLVEGSNDVPVFKAWLSKSPSYRDQNVAVLALGGSDASSSNFDADQWRSLHPTIFAILDSERKTAGEEPQKEKQEIKTKLEKVGIRCHLTERRSTESYFTRCALQMVYGDFPESMDPFGDPNLANQGVKQFAKFRNGAVAQAMEWTEVEKTDLGMQIEYFLKS